MWTGGTSEQVSPRGRQQERALRTQLISATVRVASVDVGARSRVRL